MADVSITIRDTLTDTKYQHRFVDNTDGTYSMGVSLAGGGAPPTGAAGGDLSGTYPNPEVAAITTTTGPTQLVIGAVADGEFLKRSGGTLIGAVNPLGDVTGPAGAVADNVATYDGVTGKIIKDSGVAITDIPTLGAALGNSETVETDGAGLLISAAKNTAYNKAFGSGAGTVTEGDDARLSDARTPTAHATSHNDGGSDELTAQSLGSGAAGASMVMETDGLGGWSLIATPNDGDVVGPAGATNNNLAAFDGVTGKLIKDSGVLTSDVPILGAPLGNNETVETNGSGQLESAAKSTAYNKAFGTSTGNVPEIGALLGNSETVETDGTGKLITAAKGTAYNKAFGTSAGTVLEGDNDALYAKLASNQTFTGENTFSNALALILSNAAAQIASAGNVNFMRQTAGKSKITLTANGAFNAEFAMAYGSDVNANNLKIQLATSTQLSFGSSVTQYIINSTKADANTVIRSVASNNLALFDAGLDAVGIGLTVPLAKLHVDQSDASGAKPVLYLDQADTGEPMAQLQATIGVGNPIEAAGAKTLTTTHFVKVEITGGLVRYFPVGTIA